MHNSIIFFPYISHMVSERWWETQSDKSPCVNFRWLSGMICVVIDFRQCCTKTNTISGSFVSFSARFVRSLFICSTVQYNFCKVQHWFQFSPMIKSKPLINRSKNQMSQSTKNRQGEGRFGRSWPRCSYCNRFGYTHDVCYPRPKCGGCNRLGHTRGIYYSLHGRPPENACIA